MKIYATLKRLPDSETKVKVGADGKSIDPAEVKYIVNPYDEFAIEQAIQLKEKHKAETTLINVDTELFTKEVRTGLAMGIDDAVFIKVEGQCDNFRVARAVADYLKEKQFDMLLMGKQAIDDDSHCIGQMIATLLDLPCVSDISTMEIEGSKVTVKRGIEGGEEVVEVELPAVFTCEKSLNKPRLASFMGIKKASKKTIEEITAAEADCSLTVEEMTLPPPKEPGKIVGEGAEAVPELLKLLREDAKAI